MLSRFGRFSDFLSKMMLRHLSHPKLICQRQRAEVLNFWTVSKLIDLLLCQIHLKNKVSAIEEFWSFCFELAFVYQSLPNSIAFISILSGGNLASLARAGVHESFLVLIGRQSGLIDILEPVLIHLSLCLSDIQDGLLKMTAVR